MINIDSIMARVNAWAKSPEGKKRLDDCIKEHAASGKALASGEKITTIEDVKRMAQDFADMVRDSMPEAIASATDNLVVGEPREISKGKYEVEIYFDAEAIHRDSLYPEHPKYQEGLRNIVKLFNCGYPKGSARDYVYGWWDGHTATTGDTMFRSFPVTDSVYTRSKKDRTGLYFLQDAVEKFNTKYGKDHDAVAILGSDYTED